MRTCFASKWKIHDDLSVLTSGRYVRLPLDAPALPFFHFLGSRDWNTENEFPRDHNGEWTGSRNYYNGEAPDSPLLAGPVGSSSDFGSPLATGSAPSPYPYAAGFPRPCFHQFPCAEEYEKLDVTAAATWKRFATIICLLHSDGPAALARLIQEFPGITASALFWDGPPTFPPWNIVAVTDCNTIVVSMGTFNDDQLSTQFLYGAIPPQDIGPFATMPLWWDAAKWFRDKITELGGENKPLFFAGHSYGAAALCVLAGVVKWNTPDRPVRMVTYGCPRPGDKKIMPFFSTVAATHLFTPGDPVGQLPPNVLADFSLGPILGTVLFDRWASLQTPQRTFVLNDDGTASQANSPSLSDAAIQSLAATIAGGLAFPSFDAHRMTSYLDYLYAMAPPLGTCRESSPIMLTALASEERCC